MHRTRIQLSPGAFEAVGTECLDINCCCDGPTEYLDILPQSDQLTPMTNDVLEYDGKHADEHIHTVCYRPANRPLTNLISKFGNRKPSYLLARLRCTLQLDHIAEMFALQYPELPNS